MGTTVIDDCLLVATAHWQPATGTSLTPAHPQQHHQQHPHQSNRSMPFTAGMTRRLLLLCGVFVTTHTDSLTDAFFISRAHNDVHLRSWQKPCQTTTVNSRAAPISQTNQCVHRHRQRHCRHQAAAAAEGTESAPHPADDELDRILKVAIKAAEKAGAIILSNSDGADVVDKKASSRDLLTLVDPMCEAAIKETVTSAFSHHNFLGEEEVGPGIDAAVEALENKLELGGYLWIVDPIDGTTNFASGIPLNAPSIAVTHNEEVVVAVILDPHRGECFTAVKGRGTYMNGERIHVGEQNVIGDAVVGMESPAGQESLEVALKGVVPLMPKVRTIRMLGSSAIMLPWVANGRLTAYWTPDECAWDIAAGSLLVSEAGGRVTDLSGGEYNIRTRKLLASNGRVHDELLAVLQDEAGIS